ncbi:hypothetical protein FG05_03719 [Fusarium graminearum]|nr:hypothetical protein FG05_03719 [Fusarium graminearum]
MTSNNKPERASFNDIEPIKVPLSADWGIRVPGHEMIKLIYGFTPRDMDDRWMCCTDGPDKEGNIRVRKVPAEAYNNEKVIEREGGVITKIVWEKPEKDEWEPMNEERAKEFAVNFSKSWMRCDLKV